MLDPRDVSSAAVRCSSSWSLMQALRAAQSGLSCRGSFFGIEADQVVRDREIEMTFDASVDWQNAAQASMSLRRLSKASPRR